MVIFFCNVDLYSMNKFLLKLCIIIFFIYIFFRLILRESFLFWKGGVEKKGDFFF